MRVEDENACEFYEREAVEGGWNKRTLERQVHTQYYERSLHAQQPGALFNRRLHRQIQNFSESPGEILKNPYVLNGAKLSFKSTKPTPASSHPSHGGEILQSIGV